MSSRISICTQMKTVKQNRNLSIIKHLKKSSNMKTKKKEREHINIVKCR